MHWRGWLAIAVVVCAASGCEGQKILCSSDSDCPLGQCNTSLGRCVLKSCNTDLDCNAGTFCNATVGKICTIIPDGGEDMTCASPCPIYQVCRATECHPRYLGVVITQPAAGQFVDGGSATVVARLDVNPGNARADPSFLALTLGLPDGGSLSGGGLSPLPSAGFYSGPLNPASDGTYILSASYTDAGLTSPQVAVTLDRVPPSFVVVVPNHGRTGIYQDPVQPTAWRRDDMVTLGIQSTEPNMVNSSVRVAVTGLGGSGPTLNVTPTSGCGQNYCGTATLDMKDPTMRAFRGTYALQVSGQDLAGNSGISNGGVGVTRWNWRFTPAGGLQGKTSPAVGNSGVVYFATTNTTDTGTVYALNPDAGVKWSMALGSVEGSLAVGDSVGGLEDVYVAVNDATSTTIRALNGNNGSEIARCGSFAGPIRTSLAVTKSNMPPDTVRESAFAVVSGSPYRMAALRPGASGALGCADAGFTGNVQTTGAIAVDNLNNAYFGDSAANAVSYNFDGGWQPRPNWPVAAGLNINAPVISGTNVVAGALGTAPARGQILSIPTSGAGGVNWRFPPSIPATVNFFNPAILAGGISNGGIAVYGDDFPNLTEIAVTATSTTAVATPSAAIMGTPALGQGNMIYTVDRGGTVAAWASDLSALWSVNPGAGGIDSGPALDCSRNLSGPIPGRPGVMYFVTNSGSLFSFVVDSRGIDTGAPWPKYQHDPRNTGNQQTPLSQFACP